MRVELPEGHNRIEFHEREFLAACVAALSMDEVYAASPFAYNPQEGWCDFAFDVDEEIVTETCDSFISDPTWNDPDKARFVELATQETLTTEEDDELRGLERMMVMRVIEL